MAKKSAGKTLIVEQVASPSRRPSVQRADPDRARPQPHPPAQDAA